MRAWRHFFLGGDNVKESNFYKLKAWKHFLFHNSTEIRSDLTFFAQVINMDLNHAQGEEKHTSSRVKKFKLALNEDAIESKTAPFDDNKPKPTNAVDCWSRIGFPVIFVLWNVTFFALTHHYSK